MVKIYNVLYKKTAFGVNVLKKNKFNVASFFSGAGGLDIGFEAAGFNIVFASDIMEQACQTYSRNFTHSKFFKNDISLITNQDLDKLKADNDIDVVIGGPPCQGFSNMGNKNSADPRNYLFQCYRKVIEHLQPTCFLFENVKGFRTMFEGRFFEKVINEFSAIGYNIHYSLLNANDYGVPQKRERIFLFGTKVDRPFKFPTKESTSFDNLRAYANVGEALNDLIDKDESVPNHIPLKHSDTVIKRYELIPEGGKLPKPEDLPVEIRRKNFGNTYTRLSRFEPSSTIVPGNNALPVHPVLNRSLTPREAARIQTFPDNYIFYGDRRSQCILVGNAVPPLLGAKLARNVAFHLNGVDILGEEPEKTINRGDVYTLNRKGKASRASLRFADLFCGVGGFTEGLKAAGLTSVLSADFDQYAVDAHRLNHQEECVKADLSNEFDRAKIIKKLKVESVDLIVGGPPCQGFSIFGNRRFVNTKKHDLSKDERNDLVHSFAEIVVSVRPKWFMMENVPGILSAHNGKYVNEVKSYFENHGYRVEFKIINCADYGVPQLRKRFLMIGTNTDLVIPWPKAKFFAEPEDWQQAHRTVGLALSGLDTEDSYFRFKNHNPPKHTKVVSDRFGFIEEGKKLEIEKLPSHLKIGTKTGKPIKNFSHVFKRLDRKKPSNTIVPGHNAFPVHPRLNRTLTVREAARIQSFHDNYEFVGPIINQCLQVGNAFPPLVAQLFGERLRTVVNKNWKSGESTQLALYSMLEELDANYL
ncbi:DNA cytosine methyltransferase [Salinimonas iocasae]|uniref:Cytosine-specific methyltransferase n=1 Tax=Salinimonas iocasae TaxID=2572577 RepID=A0A5B7Y9V8_9ALTE|nr:DNA cytosine methyltransferase [Salinimonas iocasae]QCZ92185.1 DNA cytosine methyltransferase [Salinimonas iocasae]